MTKLKKNKFSIANIEELITNIENKIDKQLSYASEPEKISEMAKISEETQQAIEKFTENFTKNRALK